MGAPSAGVTVIIPAYNEERGLAKILPALARLATSKGWEVIVIDDGSTDGTAAVAREHGALLVSHPENVGYGAALKSGIRRASRETVVMMDADGQHDPSLIDRLLEHMDRYDMVVGARRGLRGIRAPGKLLLALVANFLAGVTIPDLNSGFRAFRRDTIRSFLHFCPNAFSFTTTITLACLREGYAVKYVPIELDEHVGNPSTVRPLRDGYQTLLLIIRVIVLFNPLKVFVPVALALFAAGLAFTVYGIVAFGRAPNTGVLTILSSVILFFMGVLADQISSLRRERRCD